MIEIAAHNLGYQYGYRWILKESELQISAGDTVSILGKNGAGKSTLLRLLAGAFTPNYGDILLKHEHDGILDRSCWYSYLSWAAPAILPPPDLSIQEVFSVHFSLKQPLIPTQEILTEINLNSFKNQAIRFLSSGQLQRLKIALAVFTYSGYILLDEPSTNLDTENFELIWHLVQKYQHNRTILIATNDPREYAYSTKQFVIENLKILSN